MTIDELEIYLKQQVSPEATEMMLDAVRVICESGLTSHLDDLDDITSLEDQKGRDVVILEVRQYITSTMEACVNQFGIEVQEDAEINLRHLTGVLRGLNMVTNYEDVEAIEAICMAEADPEEKLTDILELLTEYTWADYALLIDKVNPSLFSRILEQIVKPDSLEEIDTQDNAILIRVKSLINRVKGPWLLDEIEDGVMLGMSVATLVERFRVRYDLELSRDPVWQRKADLVAEQYLLYILASDCPDDKLLATAQDQLEVVISHVPTLSAASRVIQQLLSQVSSS